MPQQSTIEWTDATWNPVTGCSKVSQGCKNCYAEAYFARPYPGRKFTEVRTHPERLDWPLRWRGSPKAKAEGRPSRIFVNSMSDLFHEDVPDSFIAAVLLVAAASPDMQFQILTKRPARMKAVMGEFNDDLMEILEKHSRASFSILPPKLLELAGLSEMILRPRWPLANVWLGVSVEDQETADERIPILLQTPAAVRWVSYEPALGPVDFRRCVKPDESDWERVNELQQAIGDDEPEEFIEECEAECDWINFGHDLVPNPVHREWKYWREQRGRLFAMGRSLNWIVAGGESGPHARPPHPDWFRSVRDQCAAAGVPFFFKQWGAWKPVVAGAEMQGDVTVSAFDGGFRSVTPGAGDYPKGSVMRCYVRKAEAGRLLDGREHNEFPALRES